MITLKGIKKSYLIGSDTNTILKGVDLTLHANELTYLVGESGSGKSTLLNIIGGLDLPSEGSYYYGEENVANFNDKEWGSFRRKNVGFIFQNFNLIPHLSALENVEMGMILDGISKQERRIRAIELLESVGLADKTMHLPSQLSGGQKQRVAIARALANDPEIILADEPTGALDSENSVIVMDILKTISQKGKIVLVVTHSKEYLTLADRVIQMKDGKIIENSGSEKKNKQKSVTQSKSSHRVKKISWSTTTKLAMRNLKNKKWRTFLTATGASIGIFGIMLIIALATGINEKIEGLFGESDLSDLIAVSNKDGLLNEQSANELLAIEEVDAVYNYNVFDLSIETESGKKTVLSGDSLLPNEYQDIYGKDYVIEGKLPTENNELIIPENDAVELYGSIGAAVGKEVTIIAQLISMHDVFPTVEIQAEISGVRGGSGMAFLDVASLSYDLSESILNANEQTADKTLQFSVLSKSKDKISTVVTKINDLGYSAMTEGDASDDLTGYVTIASFAVAMLSGISLIVSSIMIGIVLYIGVVERMREIGTLKAIGALKVDIRRIFVTEGFALGAIGGALGIAVSLVVSIIINWIIKDLLGKSDLDLFEFKLIHMCFIILLSGILGMIASYIPAFKASRLQPVEALKYE